MRGGPTAAPPFVLIYVEQRGYRQGMARASLS